ncbi:MAG: DUF2127 domain-containing protein [Gallionellaceae bacterium]|jgi:uncharacterized membrane protein (DUF2068 family)|nr:DUF2127 domain-containing protein [Gallionellaceae bacterium]
MPHPSRSIRAVALFEAGKGLLALLSGCGALSLLHHDTGLLAGQLVGHLHLDAAKHYPSIFIDAASRLTDARLWKLAALSAVYTIVRWAEAYGLWNNRRWAEWLAAVSGGIYMPFEIYELLHRFSWLAIAALAANVLIVWLMVNALRGRLNGAGANLPSAVAAPMDADIPASR